MFTLLGKPSITPPLDTTANFLKALLLTSLLLPWFINNLILTIDGVILAITFSAITSGLGYAIWYAALRIISLSQAAIFQLLVPIIAASTGIIFIGEPIKTHFIVASIFILGGILMFIKAKRAE